MGPILRSFFLNVNFLLSYELAENNGKDSKRLLSRRWMKPSECWFNEVITIYVILQVVK